MLPLFLQRVQERGYTVFTHGEYNLNFVGVRANTARAGKFDDWITCWYKDSSGSWNAHWWAATTDPGVYWLENPTKRAGTAIMMEGQHAGLWKIGTHKGYKAFQQASKVKVYRDNTKDDVLDINPDSFQEGIYGINGHASDSNPWDSVDKERAGQNVGKWSAGCQVWASSAGFRQAVQLAEQSAALGKYGSKFTYTLVKESEIYV
jgi:hypothetical protein